MMAQLHPETAAALGNLLHKLSGNAKTRQKTLELIKEVEPGYKLPADVEIAHLRAELAAERAKEKQENQVANAQRRRSQQRNKLVEQYGEDEVKRIEEGVLKKYPHLDLEDAAKLHAADTQPATPRSESTSRHGQLWEYPVPEGVTPQAFIANPEKTAQDVAYSIIDGFRGRVR